MLVVGSCVMRMKMKKWINIGVGLTVIIGAGLWFIVNIKENVQNNGDILIQQINPTNMLITSSAFMNGEPIPSRFTCDVRSRTNEDGGDVNPELLIQNVPGEAKSLALIMDDPDALPAEAKNEGEAKEGAKPFTHWTVWGIDPKTSLIKEESMPPYSIEGTTDFGKIGYGGPCPPSGKPHRYFFRLFALDTKLDLASGASRSELEEAMAGHIIEKAELMGTYAR